MAACDHTHLQLLALSQNLRSATVTLMHSNKATNCYNYALKQRQQLMRLLACTMLLKRAWADDNNFKS